jgi:hypothetical protein
MEVGFGEILHNTIPFFCLIPEICFFQIFLLVQAEEFDLQRLSHNLYKPADLVWQTRNWNSHFLLYSGGGVRFGLETVLSM